MELAESCGWERSPAGRRDRRKVTAIRTLPANSGWDGPARCDRGRGGRRRSAAGEQTGRMPATGPAWACCQPVPAHRFSAASRPRRPRPDGRREVVDGRVGLRRIGVVADEFVLQGPGLRPVKARVSRVRVKCGSASASLCSCRAPLSSVRRKRCRAGLPTAPARSTASSPAASMMPPAATSGRSTADRTSGEQLRRRAAPAVVPSAVRDPPVRLPDAGRNAALCPPALVCCTTRASTPCPAACTASAAVVTVASTADPARCRARTTSGPGQPEGETDQLHGVCEQGIDLSLPFVVVIEPQLRELHAVAPGIGTQLLPVILELRQHRRGTAAARPDRDEHIHAEPGAGLPEGADFRLHGRHALVACREEAQPAGAVHGLDEGRLWRCLRPWAPR